MRGVINVGRDYRCEIALGENCIYASGLHATIYMENGQLMYWDKSRNGTLVNNVQVHNRVVPINPGDVIMIASTYPLDWTQINSFFPIPKSTQCLPPQPQPMPLQNEDCEDEHASNAPSPRSYSYEKQNVQPKLGWNWGAFSLYPFWGFWNGCWWGILIALFFGWSIIPNILFGAMGSRWAWENKIWDSVDAFNRRQDAWKPWGIFFFVLWIASIFVFIAQIK